MCLESSFWRSLRCSKRGVMKLGMTDFFHVGELIPRSKTMKGMSEPMRARTMHMVVINIWMNPNTEQKFCTALVSQFCQALRGYNCVNTGLKLLESEQMGCRGAGVVQITLMSVIASTEFLTTLAHYPPHSHCALQLRAVIAAEKAHFAQMSVAEITMFVFQPALMMVQYAVVSYAPRCCGAGCRRRSGHCPNTAQHPV